jgi:hypothetical protein
METGHNFHKDSFGLLQSVLTGASTWTLRLVRDTKIALPHIAKNDVFTYYTQINHDKLLGSPLDSFHIHFVPVGAVTATRVIAIDYKWGWFTIGDEIPATLPNTGTVYITLELGDQFKYLIENIVSSLQIIPPLEAVSAMNPPAGEGYSSEFFIECQRRNDAADTYPGEFALLDGDIHYQINHLGSYEEYND